MPAGRYEVAFRLLGYAAILAMLNFLPEQKLDGDFMLKPLATTLAKVEVTGTAPTATGSMAMVKFGARRKRGGGRFLTQDVLDKNENRLISDLLLTKRPGLHANALGSSGRVMASGRSTVSLSTETSQAERLDKFERQQGIKLDCYLQFATQFVWAQALPAQSTMRILLRVPGGALRGTVIAEKTERPLRNANIMIRKLGFSTSVTAKKSRWTS